MRNYSDIIDLPHHVSTKHARMSLYDRAAQFSPFAALTGYDAEIKEAARVTDKKAELDDDVKLQISDAINDIAANIKSHPTVKITFFRCDDKKTGGEYIDIINSVKKINDAERKLILSDGTEINIDDIAAISHLN